MITQYSEQVDYIEDHSLGSLATVFILFNFFTQIFGSGLILSKKYIQLAVGLLFSSILAQIFAYKVWHETAFLMRSFSLVGAVCLMLAEHWNTSSGNIFNQNIGYQDKNHVKKNVILLSGRILLTLMVFSMMHADLSYENILKNSVGFILIGLVAIGYKTKMACFVAVCWLSLINIWFNDFWMHSPNNIIMDYKKFDFFQTVTVIGGLVTLIMIGPGEMCLDEMKKDI